MVIWQADFYRRPLRDKDDRPLWELAVCDSAGGFEYFALCPQSEANLSWLISQLRRAAGDCLPETIAVFRPQSLSLMEEAGKSLGIKVEATRRVGALKKLLRDREGEYRKMEGYSGEACDILAVESPPPLPLPENLWGDRWRLAALDAGMLVEAFGDRPIPILEIPEFLLPFNLGLASSLPIPGVIIDGGRRSMFLARWLEEARPFSIKYVPGEPDGLILEAGLNQRWVLATFEDKEVGKAGKVFEERKEKSKGLHFLLVQPDDSGMTYTGFWLLSN
jgi:hypothetical protein